LTIVEGTVSDDTGFNGIYDHLASRAAFFLSSPDPPEA
jgi:hypothetical protein